MKKISVKNLIDFRRKNNDSTKLTFVNNLRVEKPKSEGSSGGDYWITSLSAISNAYKHEDTDFLDQKIEELIDKIEVTQHKIVKDQFQRNIDILNAVKEINLKDYKPDSKLNYLKQPNNISLLQIHGLPIESKPRFIFTFNRQNDKEIGGIWFVAKLKGYKPYELGMFAEMIFKYLEKNHSDDYFVNTNYCIALDVTDCKSINYQEVVDGKVPSLIESTIDEFKKF